MARNTDYRLPSRPEVIVLEGARLLFGGSPLDHSTGYSVIVPFSDFWDWTGKTWVKVG
jgi:hypothetical protein